MTTDLENRLREELAGLATTTRTAPGALDAIVERAGRGRRGSRALLVAAAAAVVVAVVAVASAGDDRGQRVTANMPPGPPEISGMVHAEVMTTPCTGDCIEARARFSITDPERLEVLDWEGRWSDAPAPGLTGPHPLRDGRFVTMDGGGSMLVDPTNGTRTALGRGMVTSADVLPDGRVVFVKVDDGAELALADAVAGTVTPVALPGGFHPSAVVTAPDGTIGVLGNDERDVMFIAPDGETSVVDVAGASEGTGTPVSGRTAMSWSATGLLAISQDLPEPWLGASSLQGWTVVVDPDDGELVAAIDGWQGLAWSPDGRGLLVARRAGKRSSDLAVHWGPELAERVDLGTVPLPVLPRFWLP